MKLIKLNCPACAGALELPDNLTVAHCVYCGNKILLEQEGLVQEHRDLQRYKELCRVAVDAKNHNEVIRYCNSILEIDPKNVEAWIDKANSTFWLTTGVNNRYDEAMEYLDKAREIANDDPRITDAREELTRKQAWWYNHLANDKWEFALRIFNIHRTTYVFGDGYGKERSQEHAVEAMNLYLRASNYDPTDLNILKNIAHCAEFYNGVQWSDRVREKINTLKLLQQKETAKARLSQIKAELEQSNNELARLRAQKGLFIGGKIKDVERHIRELQNEIPNLDKAASFVAPNPLAHRAKVRADPLYEKLKAMLYANGNLKLDDVMRELGIDRQRAIDMFTLITVERLEKK